MLQEGIVRVKGRFSFVLFLTAFFLAFLWAAPALGQNSGTSIQAVTRALQSGDHKKALWLVRVLVQNQPNDSRAWTLDGVVLSGMKQPQDGLMIQSMAGTSRCNSSYHRHKFYL